MHEVLKEMIGKFKNKNTNKNKINEITAKSEKIFPVPNHFDINSHSIFVVFSSVKYLLYFLLLPRMSTKHSHRLSNGKLITCFSGGLPPRLYLL